MSGGKASRRKGASGELEVAAVLRRHGFDARRTPNSGGLAWRGDLAGVPGYVIEVKRVERLSVPAWLEQAHAAARGGDVPVVAFRRSAPSGGVTGQWHAIISLEELARLIAVASRNDPDDQEPAPTSGEARDGFPVAQSGAVTDAVERCVR